MVVLVACAAIFFIARTLAPQTLGEQARRVFEKQLGDHYADWDVSIRRGVYRPGIGLQFERIALTPKSRRVSELVPTTWLTEPAVTIDSITVFADVHPEKLFSEGSPLTTRRVVVEGFQANMTISHDGSLSLSGLWPPPQLGPICPRIEFHSATLNLNVAEQNDRPIQFRLADVTVDTLCGPSTNQREFVSDQRVLIRGESDVCGQFDVQVRHRDSQSGTTTTRAQSVVRQWHVDQTIVKRIQPWISRSPSLSKWLNKDVKFDVDGDLRMQATYQTPLPTRPNSPAILDYQVICDISDGMILDDRLGSDVRRIHGQLKCTPKRLELIDAGMNLGDARCSAAASVDLQVLQLSSDVFAVSTIHESSFVVPTDHSKWIVSVENADLSLTAENWHVDDRYRSLLSRSGKQLFDRFEPDGRISLQSRFKHAAPLATIRSREISTIPWAVQASVQCESVDITFDKFPYPVEELNGAIEIADGQIETKRLTGLAGGHRIHCAFRVPLKLSPDQVVSPEKSVLIQSEGAIPIDDALIAALTPKKESDSARDRDEVRPRRLGGAGDVDGQPWARGKSPRDVPGTPSGTPTGTRSTLEEFVRSLQPRGAVQLASALIQTDARGETSKQIDLRVTGGTLRYDKFAYPLYNVAGRIQVRNELVRLIGFTANNAGAAKIACDGLYQMSQSFPEKTPSELNMRFRVADLAMDQALRVSLPESTRTIWDALMPAGTLDQVDIQIHRSGNSPIDLSLNASQGNGGNTIPTDALANLTNHLTATQSITNPVTDEIRYIKPESTTLSIRPKAIPFRIDIVGGQVKYRDNEIEITNLRGRHDASRLIADGRCRPDANGRWRLSLDLHTGCKLIPDDELITALPDQMASAMRGLDLRGPLGLRGMTNIRLPDDTNPDPALDWDVIVQLEGNRISDVGPIHSLRGEIEIRGVKDGDLIRAAGTVAIDSLHAFGYQVAGIRGPFSIAGDFLRIGTLSFVGDPINGQPINDANGRPITATPLVGNVFGGLIDVSGTVALSSGDFDVGASLSNAKIATILAELGQTRSGMTGRLDMNSRLEGRLTDTDLLKGSGTGRLSGANLYELPLIVQTLNLLRITPTEAVAFTDGETEFAIFGENVQFNKLTLWGDLVALDGGGTLSRQEYLDLSFNTRVSPQNLFSKVLNPIRDTSYTFWTIEVTGPIGAPTIQRRALSGVSQTFENWFPGMVRSTTADTTKVAR